MRTYRINKEKLHIDVALNKIYSWLLFTTIYQIGIPDTHKLMKPVFHNIPVNHFIVCVFHFCNLIFDLIFKYHVKLFSIWILFTFFSISFMLIKHFS